MPDIDLNENLCGACEQERKLCTFENQLPDEMGGGFVGTAVMLCGCGYDVRAKRFTIDEEPEEKKANGIESPLKLVDRTVYKSGPVSANGNGKIIT